MSLRRRKARLVLFGVLLYGCYTPPSPPRYALTVRDPDKLCRLIAFSRCARPIAAESGSDAGVDDQDSGHAERGD